MKINKNGLNWQRLRRIIKWWNDKLEKIGHVCHGNRKENGTWKLLTTPLSSLQSMEIFTVIELPYKNIYTLQHEFRAIEAELLVIHLISQPVKHPLTDFPLMVTYIHVLQCETEIPFSSSFLSGGSFSSYLQSFLTTACKLCPRSQSVEAQL